MRNNVPSSRCNAVVLAFKIRLRALSATLNQILRQPSSSLKTSGTPGPVIIMLLNSKMWTYIVSPRSSPCSQSPFNGQLAAFLAHGSPFTRRQDALMTTVFDLHSFLRTMLLGLLTFSFTFGSADLLCHVQPPIRRCTKRTRASILVGHRYPMSTMGVLSFSNNAIIYCVFCEHVLASVGPLGTPVWLI